MNSASQDFRHHLAVLRQRAEHSTDYEKAIDYFGREFATDDGFHAQSVEASPEWCAWFEAVLSCLLAGIVGKPVQLRATVVLHLPEFGFYHGCAMMERRCLAFFYFQDAGLGILSLIPGFRGNASHVARFQAMLGPTIQPRNPQRN